MFLDPHKDIEKSGRDLPHWEQGETCQFVTFRLGDSLPQSKVKQWQEELTIWRETNPEPWSPEQHDTYHRRFTYRLEDWLDSGHGECLLRDPKCRQILAEVLMKFQGDRVLHHAWVIMPNHVHLLFTPKVPLHQLIKAWKGASSRQMGRGNIWQPNYRDTLIRDSQHFTNAARYIRRNPKGLAPDSYSLWEGERVQAIE